MCIRADMGVYVLAKTLCFSPVCSVDAREALGLYHAIMWVNELQLANVAFEVDSKKIADYFTKGRIDITEFEAVMQSCKHYVI